MAVVVVLGLLQVARRLLVVDIVVRICVVCSLSWYLTVMLVVIVMSFCRLNPKP